MGPVTRMGVQESDQVPPGCDEEGVRMTGMSGQRGADRGECQVEGRQGGRTLEWAEGGGEEDAGGSCGVGRQGGQ